MKPRSIIVKFRKRESPYTLIDKACLMDARLSWRAMGILAHCMALPPHLRVSFASLIESATDGAKSLKAGFRELSALGYAQLERVRDNHGHFIGTQWIIYESPDLCSEDSKK